jgi:hypothetical protein
MIFPNPEWLSAGADLAIAAETGVTVFGKSGRKTSDEVPGASAVAVRTVSFDAVLIFTGLVIVAAAMLFAAAVIHHGLTA